MSKPRVAAEWAELYEGYFPDDPVEARKNALAAADSVDAVVRLCGPSLGDTVDVGAGDGVVSAELHARGSCSTITALEISVSGLGKIQARNLPVVAQRFDGYEIPFGDGHFDTAVCAHVVEHVEHERMFLKEVGRVAKRCVFIVPLEGGLRGRVDRRMGHINYYTPATFQNLIETSGFDIVEKTVYPSSSAYEQHLHGKVGGALRNAIRNAVLKMGGGIAPHLMVYVMAVHCMQSKVTR
jgi:SAM-dependent methyltransferase